MQLDSLAAFKQLGDRRGSSATLNNLGNLSVEMGNLDAAKKYFEQALALAREITYLGGQPYPMSGLGDVQLARGDMGGARKQYQQALALCEEIKDEDFASQIHNALAFLALVEGRLAPDGEGLARQAVARVREGQFCCQRRGGACHAGAQSVRRKERSRKAATAATHSVALSRQGASETARFEATLADSRVKAKLGKGVEARQELETMQTSARKFGYRIYEYQARLAMGEIELWAGNPARPCSSRQCGSRRAGAGLTACREAGEGSAGKRNRTHSLTLVHFRKMRRGGAAHLGQSHHLGSPIKGTDQQKTLPVSTVGGRKLRICAFRCRLLASGSRGNCALVASSTTRILVDAGLSGRETFQATEGARRAHGRYLRNSYYS